MSKKSQTFGEFLANLDNEKAHANWKKSSITEKTKEFIGYIHSDEKIYTEIMNHPGRYVWTDAIIAHAKTKKDERLILSVKSHDNGNNGYIQEFELEYVDETMLPVIITRWKSKLPSFKDNGYDISDKSFDKVKRITEKLGLTWLDIKNEYTMTLETKAWCIPKTNKTSELVIPNEKNESIWLLREFIKVNKLKVAEKDITSGYIVANDKTHKFITMDKAKKYIEKSHYPICHECGQPFNILNAISPNEIKEHFRDEFAENCDCFYGEYKKDIDFTKSIHECNYCGAIYAMIKKDKQYILVNSEQLYEH